MNPAHGGVSAVPIEVRIQGRTVLPGRVWCAERPRALVAVLHGLGEHGGRYAALAEALVARRFTVAALDLPGHGEAGGRRGDFQSWEAVRDHAVPAAFTAPRGIPGQPLDLAPVLLGHSLGGLLALDYAIAHPRVVFAVAACAPAMRTPPPPAWRRALAVIAGAVAPATPFANGIDEANLSRDPEVLRERAADRLVHDRVTPRLYFAMRRAQRRVMAAAHRLAVPALLLQGTGDRTVEPRGALELNAAAPHGMARLISYPDGRHELLNDTDRARVLADLVAWLDAVVVV